MNIETMDTEKQSGFNLIESMVTLFILSVGILGVVALQAVAITAHKDSAYISEANRLADRLAERVRANPRGRVDGFYDQTGGANAGAYTASCTSTSGCSAEEMAHTDLYEWQQEVENKLPGGKGIICRDSSLPAKTSLTGSDLDTAALGSCDGAGDTYVIHVMWERTRDSQLRLETSGGALNPKSSDGYIQFVFVP